MPLPCGARAIQLSKYSRKPPTKKETVPGTLIVSACLKMSLNLFSVALSSRISISHGTLIMQDKSDYTSVLVGIFVLRNAGTVGNELCAGVLVQCSENVDRFLRLLLFNKP